MKKLQIILFTIKIIITIFFTSVFNQFLTDNFNVNIYTLVVSSLIFSTLFFSFLSKELELYDDIKQLFN